MEALWALSSLGRVRSCRRWAHGQERGIVTVGRCEGHGYVSGVVTCGSVWCCPLCGSRIRGERVQEIATALGSVVGAGGSIELLTVTIPHERSDGLGELQELLQGAWHAIRNDRLVKRLLELGEEEGYVRGLDHTHGGNGWHAHFHAHEAFRADLHPGHRAHLQEAMTAAATRFMRRKGRPDLDPTHGITWKPLSLHEAVEAAAGYLTKPTSDLTKEAAAHEVSGGRGKRGRNGQRTPWEVLADLADLGDVEDLAIWREYEAATHGKRQLTWSRGFRDRHVRDAEKSDEEIAAAGGDEGEALVETDGATWARIPARAGWAEEVITVASQDGDRQDVIDDLKLWFWARKLPIPAEAVARGPDRE